MKKGFGQISFVVCLLLLAIFVVKAQNPVSLSMSVSPNSIPAGGKGSVRISAGISGDWHMYSVTQGAGGPIPTKITIDGGPFKMGGVSGTRPSVKFDPNFNINTETYSGSATLNVAFTVAGDAPEGAQSLNVNVRYQVCNETTCLPPKTVKLSAPLTIIAAKVSASPTPNEKESPTPTLSPTQTVSSSVTPIPANTNVNSNINPKIAADISNAETSNSNSVSGTRETNSNEAPPSTNFGNGAFNQNMTLWSFLWAAIIAGAISLLTPCVFPMIPITVSYFTNHAEGSRAKATQNAFVFALGIIFTFTVLGFLLAVLFGAAGINKLASNPYINIFIGGLFITFAMSLFGAYELGVPTSVLTKLDAFARGKASSKYLGLLLMGFVFSLTSFTCTTPFVGGILVLATQGSWLYPILGMLAFSAVFSFPFFLLALAPQFLAQLPKSGGWLNSVKVIMGFLEIAAAMKFISNVDLVWGWGFFTREVVLATWVAVGLLISLYLLGKFQLSHDTKPERLGAVRVMIALIFLSLSFYLLTGLFGRNLWADLESFLPPRVENSNTVSAANLGSGNNETEWITNDYEKALAKTKAENKLLFIDFTGYTCTNCRWMEINMFPRPKVKEELGKYVRARLYTDGEGEPFESFQKMQEQKFSTVALPLYAIVDGNGKTILTFAGLTRDENDFVKFLQAGQGRQ